MSAEIVARMSLGLKIEDYSSDSVFRMPAGQVYKSVLTQTLPSNLDTRILDVFPVRNQLDQGACVAFAASAIANNLEYYDTSELTEWVAPQYLYNLRPNYPSIGMKFSDLPALLQEHGVVPESLFPYGKVIGDKSSIPKEILQFGSNYKMAGFANINELKELKATLHTNRAGAIMAFEVFNYTKEFWVQHPGEESEGFHAVAAVAYDDATETITLQNSWGAKWGDAGFTQYPYRSFEQRLHKVALGFVDETGSPRIRKMPASEDDYVSSCFRKCCSIL